MKPKVQRLIEQELFRRASILVEARRIALAEHLILEKDAPGKNTKAVKQAIRNLIQQAEDAGDEGDEKTSEKLLDRAEKMAKENGLSLNDVKAKVKPNLKKAEKPAPEPEPEDDIEDDDTADDEPEDTPVKKTEVGGVADKADTPDDEADDEPVGHVGGDDDDEDAPPMPKDGTADDDIKKGEVTYKIQGKKFGEFEVKAIPAQWFQQWLEREKFGPADLKAKLVRTQQTARELTPPRTDDRDKLNNFRERQSGYQNKIKAIQNVLRDLQKRDNKGIDDHNKKQDRRKDRINSLVDTLSGGNPLMKVIVGLLADKLLKNKDKVNYTGESDPYGDDD